MDTCHTSPLTQTHTYAHNSNLFQSHLPSQLPLFLITRTTYSQPSHLSNPSPSNHSSLSPPCSHCQINRSITLPVSNTQAFPRVHAQAPSPFRLYQEKRHHATCAMQASPLLILLRRQCPCRFVCVPKRERLDVYALM
jgi:hypothetical protein